jgi:hypothetical protein
METITKEDLYDFRQELLNDLKRFVSEQKKLPEKPWLKGTEVKKLLSISAGTLQTLRVSGKLKSTKLGGTHYYRFEDIRQMMESAFKGKNSKDV